ncbi:MAG: hypothetical protein NT003_02510 [Candidatus Magasanikbacteria bacterium]|nr:hypothetical protein [Candidatus Magasanikbacteria bacterium]
MEVYLRQFAHSKPTPNAAYHFLVNGDPIIHRSHRSVESVAVHTTSGKMQRFFEPRELFDLVRTKVTMSLEDLKIGDVWHVGEEFLVSFFFRSQSSANDMLVVVLSETEHGKLLHPYIEALTEMVGKRDPAKFFEVLIERIEHVEKYHARFKTAIARGTDSKLKKVGELMNTLPNAKMTPKSITQWNDLYEQTMKDLEQSVIKLPAIKSKISLAQRTLVERVRANRRRHV